MADNDILQGFQIGLQGSLRMQELKSQAAIRRIHEENAAKALSLKIQENDLAIQERADMAKAVATAQLASSPTINVPMLGQEGIGDMAPPLMPIDNPNPMTRESAAMQFVLPVVAKYRPDKVPDFLEGVALAEYRKKVESEFTPTGGMVDVPNPEGGTRRVPFVKTSRGAAQLVVEPTIENLTNPQTGQTTPVLRTGPSSARALPQDIGARQKAQFDRQQKAKMVDWVKDKRSDLLHLLVRDENGELTVPDDIVAQVAKSAGLQTSTQAMLEQQQIGADNVFAVGKRLLPLLNDSTVGPTGWWKREIVAKVPFIDKVFGTEGVTDAVAAESVGRQFMAQIFKTLRSDSNINKDEVNRLESAAPDSGRFLTKPSTEKVKLYEFLVNAGALSRGNALKTGKPITPAFLTHAEILARVQSGEITGDAGIQMWENSATSLIEQLKAELGR